MGALEWISSFVEWLGKFFPRWTIIETHSGAVKFVRGSKPVALGPGIHWHWPVTTTFFVVPTARQTDDLRSQTMLTTDDKTITVGGMVIHRVTDPLKLTAYTYDGPTTIKEITMTAIHDVVCRMSYRELRTAQQDGTLEARLRRAAQRQLTAYGVRVIKVMLTDLSPARVIKLIQSTSVDG